jgi:hypothetical protein
MKLAPAKAARIQPREQAGPQRIRLGRCVAVVVDAQAAAEVDVVDGDACSLDRLHQVQHAVHGVQVRCVVGDLRADVAIDADHTQSGQRRSALVGRPARSCATPNLLSLRPVEM